MMSTIGDVQDKVGGLEGKIDGLEYMLENVNFGNTTFVMKSGFLGKLQGLEKMVFPGGSAMILLFCLGGIVVLVIVVIAG